MPSQGAARNTRYRGELDRLGGQREPDCCNIASDYCEARYARDVNLLHIPAESSLRAYDERVHVMADYRAYLVDRDGHIWKAVPLVCWDDAEAIRKARPLAVNQGVELWQLARKVAVFPPPAQNETGHAALGGGKGDHLS